MALPQNFGHWSMTTLGEVPVSRSLFQKILSLIDNLQPRPAPAWVEEIHGEVERTGEVRLNDGKSGRMGFWTPPTDENRAIRKAETENRSNDGAIWVTLPWKPSYLGYIGLVVVAERFRAATGGPR